MLFLVMGKGDVLEYYLGRTIRVGLIVLIVLSCFISVVNNLAELEIFFAQ